MLKLILFILTLGFFGNCYAQDEYIGFNKTHVKQTLGRVKRTSLKTIAKETDSTIVCAVRDAQARGMVMVFYFNKNEICNKVLEMFEVDSCYESAFKNILNKRNLEWTEIIPQTFLSKYSKKLLLFKNPNAPLSYVLQHNKYMTKEQYNSFLPKGSFNAQKLSQN